MCYRVIDQQCEILVQNGPADAVVSRQGPEDLIGWQGLRAAGSGQSHHLAHPEHGPDDLTARLAVDKDTPDLYSTIIVLFELPSTCKSVWR